MYLNNKYTKWYMKLIDSRKKLNRSRKDNCSYDEHHIIPRSLGGSNHKSNKVLLSPREHFIAHLLLTKMLTGKHKRSMVYALVRFIGKNKKKYECFNSKIYEYIIETNRKHLKGKNNPFFGKTHSEETKRKMREKQIWQLGKNNPFFGKTHSEETKKKLSIKALEREQKFREQGQPIAKLIVSEETKRKMRENHWSKTGKYIPWNKNKKGVQKAWNKGLTKETDALE